MCMYCAADLHIMCESASDDLNCCCPELLGSVSNREPAKRGGPLKPNGEDMADVLSTGRKRAAIAAPIEPDTVCEWAKRKFAGGGIVPIIGCVGNPATDRHHGPDKSVLNNELFTNLHRICSTCHNRWHTKNDPYYGERPDSGREFLPLSGELLQHDPGTLATDKEIFDNEMKWRRNDRTSV